METTVSETAQRQFAEELALVYEHIGLPRMAGRILGWLLICVPAEQSAGSLARALNASKGSISSMTRLLIQVGCIQKTSLPGRRGDFFRIETGAPWKVMKERVQLLDTLARKASRALELLSDASPEERRRLEEYCHVHEALSREIASLMERCSAAASLPGSSLSTSSAKKRAKSSWALTTA
jgi:DNA-binding transcriptional regulator GbsR (MarR family)